MILVDTSVMIGYLKGKMGNPYDDFDYIISCEIPYGIAPFVYQEVLQGARNKKEFNTVKEYLGSLPFYETEDKVFSFEKAAHIYIMCREKGFTIRSTIDIIIAQIAIENDLYLLHDDNDFLHIAEVVEDLKLYNPALFMKL